MLLLLLQTQNFITAMDNLDLNIRSVDEVQPAVADVMQRCGGYSSAGPSQARLHHTHALSVVWLLVLLFVCHQLEQEHSTAV